MGSPLGALPAGASCLRSDELPLAALPPPALPSRELQLPWEPLLTETDVARGLSYYGSGRRLQAVAAKLLAGAWLCRAHRGSCTRQVYKSCLPPRCRLQALLTGTGHPMSR